MALYDFLYKNETVLQSFYAQLYDGLLKGRESKDRTQERDTSSIEGGLKPVVSGKLEGYRETSEEKTHHIDPHDLITVDVLSYLNEHAKSVEDASNRDIVSASGTMFVMNKSIIMTIGENLTSFGMLAAGNKKQETENRKFANMFNKSLGSLNMEPLVFIESDGCFIAGTVKEQYLSETIAGFHLKHGGCGLSDVRMLGILETGSDDPSFYGESFIQGAMTFSEAIKNIIIPPGAHIVTPIALFREVNL